MTSTHKAPLPTLANIPLVPRRRLRDGTIPQNGLATSPGSSSRGSRTSTAGNGNSTSSRSSSRSGSRGGSVPRRGVQRLRGGAVGGGRNKEDAVEIGDSDEDDDGVEVIDVDAPEVERSFETPSKSKRQRKTVGHASDQASSSNPAAFPSPPPTSKTTSAPTPDPACLPENFRAHTSIWTAHHPDPAPRLWSLSNLLSPREDHPSRYAMIILNQPIVRDDVFRRAWNASVFRVCADGGANRLHDHLNEADRQSFLPDLIKGDLDSLRPDVRAFYADQGGVEVIQDPDEYSTDLMKCITEIEEREATMIKGGGQMPIILMGGLSGRVDQTVHTMSLLHKLRTRRSELYVLNGESVAWVLDEGSHLIDIDHTTMGQTCGILPVGVDSAVVTTQGLKWDIDGETSMNGLLSTSNHLLPENPAVFLKTDRPIMWCIEIKEPLPVMLSNGKEHGSGTE